MTITEIKTILELVRDHHMPVPDAIKKFEADTEFKMKAIYEVIGVIIGGTLLMLAVMYYLTPDCK